MRVIKVFLAPLLLLAIITTSLYFGLVRPGAVDSIARDLISKEDVRKEMAHELVNQLVTSDNAMIKALLTTDRPKAEKAIAASLREEQEQREIASAAESVSSALFTGKSEVTIDSKPIFRPIYQGIDAVFPILKLEQSQLEKLEPITIGKDQNLPNLQPVRTGLTFALLLWPLWAIFAFLYGRRRPRAVAIQTLVIAGISLVVTLVLPAVLSNLLSQPLQRSLAQVVLHHTTSPAMWISLVLVILASGLLVMNRKSQLVSESVVPGQDSSQS